MALLRKGDLGLVHRFINMMNVWKDLLPFVAENSVCIIDAEPGSGKTTQIPWLLSQESKAKILVLEPRRLAAQTAARFVAKQKQKTLGEEIGYVVRWDSKYSSNTQVLYATEGIFPKILAQNPTLKGYSHVLLDEFHERHLETDFAFALVRKLQNQGRSDLKLLLLSASLSDNISFPRLKVPGRVFPVRVNYWKEKTDNLPINFLVTQAVEQISSRFEEGHTLVFLPGRREIELCAKALQPLLNKKGALLKTLHGDDNPETQEDSLAQSQQPKVILSTNIAETSLTIEDLAFVIDSGLERHVEFDVWSQMPRRKTRKISQASALQRAGRAGRTKAGECIRLYTENDFRLRPSFHKVAIEVSDLTQMLLQASALGFDFSSLDFPQLPPEKHYKESLLLLKKLGAVDEKNQITSVGQNLSSLPLPIRLARTILAPEPCYTEEILQKVLFLSAGRDPSKAQKQLLNSLEEIKAKKMLPKERSLEDAFFPAFFDFVAKRIRDQEFLLSNGEKATLSPRLNVHDLEYIIATSCERDERRRVWIQDFIPCSKQHLEQEAQIFETIEWVENEQRVIAREGLRYDSIVLEEEWNRRPKSLEAQKLLLKMLNTRFPAPFEAESTEQLKSNLARLALAGTVLSVETVLEKITSRLVESGVGLSFSEVKNCDLNSVLMELVGFEVWNRLEKEFPEFLQLSRRKVRILYEANQNPRVEAKIQEFFGRKSLPTIAGGKMKLTAVLLGPHMRPLQVTDDLEGFWQRHYPELRRELMRRYPRHPWPENPLA